MKEDIIIGYTTGVFDLFHIGHLNILKKAKQNCDFLIVGVSTDELVEAYKNKRPVIPFEERVEIVSSIKYVDKVIPQETMDKYEAWKTLHYNRLFHGDDWRGSDMYVKTEELLKSEGVDVVFFPYTKHTSSTMITKIIEKISYDD